jgi:hypothetical protein
MKAFDHRAVQGSCLVTNPCVARHFPPRLCHRFVVGFAGLLHEGQKPGIHKIQTVPEINNRADDRRLPDLVRPGSHLFFRAG